MKMGDEDMKRDISIKMTILLSAVFCLLLTISKIPTAHAETSSVVGFYINEDKPRQFIELYPDETFFLQGEADGFTGRYKVVGKIVNLRLDFLGIAQKGEIRGDILIIDNDVYKKIKKSKESWKFVVEATNGSAFYVDVESIASLSASVVRFNELIFPRTNSESYSKYYEAKGYRYQTNVTEIDCANNMVRDIKFSFFDKDGILKGEGKYSENWVKIEYGSVAAQIKKTVCLGIKEGKKQQKETVSPPKQFSRAESPSTQLSPGPPEKITIASLTKDIPDANYFREREETFNVSFNDAWDTITTYLAKEKFKFRTSDRERGIIITDIQLGKFGNLKKQYAVSIEKLSETSIKITVKGFAWDQNARGQWQTFTTLGRDGLSNEFLKKIRKELQTKLKD